ncbi:ADP-ribosylglycohydrolase family protein [Botrimarina sp.]|uniref:ADP-ribosylglycohydrolase family protein n=1 Tax=Botrimarina sp. TaxID=2795802 RepID=UPI0032EAD702
MTFPLAAVCVAAAILGGLTGAAAAAQERSISLDEFRDRVRGGWAGKMIGVAYGYPTEFDSNGAIIEYELDWETNQVANALEQDDLYVGMTLAETMDRLGLDATTEQYGEAFKQSKYKLWHANAAARRLLNLGVKAPMSGHPKHNIHANDIDFQIEADFIGMMCPGLPQQSNRYCDRVGRVMNYGDGLYGGMFVSGMYAAGYFDKRPQSVVRAGLACLPAESEYAQLIRDVVGFHERSPDDWRACWRHIEQRWNKHDSCIDGALEPFNIDAKLNGGYVALGLLYGNNDFARTIEIATRAGQDSDCNPSTAAGVLGVMHGYDWIPEKWKAGIAKIEGDKFKYTQSSLVEICQSTVDRAQKVVESVGGRVEDGKLIVPVEDPSPAPLEQWSMGIPKERLAYGDAAFSFGQGWSEGRGRRLAHMVADSKGAEMTLRFNGTAVALVGDCLTDGGRAEVFLDDEPAAPIDAYAAWATRDNALWHAYGLAPGDHTLRVVVSGDAHPSSTGKRVLIHGAVVYADADPRHSQPATHAAE